MKKIFIISLFVGMLFLGLVNVVNAQNHEDDSFSILFNHVETQSYRVPHPNTLQKTYSGSVTMDSKNKLLIVGTLTTIDNGKKSEKPWNYYNTFDDYDAIAAFVNDGGLFKKIDENNDNYVNTQLINHQSNIRINYHRGEGRTSGGGGR